jgi:hypothetical protein
MSSSYFYTDIQKDELTKVIIDYFEEYAQKKNTQVYLINKPLGENKYTYNQSKVIVLLIPKTKIAFINIGESNEAFEDFYEEPKDIVPIEEGDEIDIYRVVLKLNDLGKAFLIIAKYLYDEPKFEFTSFSVNDVL